MNNIYYPVIDIFAGPGGLGEGFAAYARNEGKTEFKIQLSIEKDIFDKLEAIKDYHGIKNITEIIRFLITKEHREIKKDE